MSEDVREGDPERRRKKKAPSPTPEEEEDRPRKKRRVLDDQNEDEDRPRKKKKRVARDDEDDSDDLGSSALSAIVPVGGSIFGLLSLWLSVLSGLLAIATAVFFFKKVVSCFLPGLWLVALLCGILAFVTHKHKASYGSITGNIRAILGILISLVVMVAHGFLAFVFFTSR